MVEITRLATDSRNNSKSSNRSDSLNRYPDLIDDYDFEEGVYEVVENFQPEVEERNPLAKNFDIVRNIQVALDSISNSLYNFVQRAGVMDRNIFSLNNRGLSI